MSIGSQIIKSALSILLDSLLTNENVGYFTVVDNFRSLWVTSYSLLVSKIWFDVSNHIPKVYRNCLHLTLLFSLFQLSALGVCLISLSFRAHYSYKIHLLIRINNINIYVSVRRSLPNVRNSYLSIHFFDWLHCR